MKKTLLLAAFALGLTANAQYTPEKNDVSIEVGFNPFHSNGKTFELKDGSVKLRWFMNENNALRIKLGLGFDNTKTTTEINDENAEQTEFTSSTLEEKVKGSVFALSLGYEHHNPVHKRIDIYYGAELGLKKISYSAEEKMSGTTTTIVSDASLRTTTTVNFSETKTHKNWDGTSGGNKSAFAFNIAAIAGVDFYLYKGLYLGAELGLAFQTTKSPNYYTDTEEILDGKLTSIPTNGYGYGVYSEYKQTTIVDGESGSKTVTTIDNTGTTITNSKELVDYSQKNNSFKLYIEPTIRLGWTF